MTYTTNRTERGWAGHLIVADKCRFRRNTLLENNGDRIVVSTVGGYVPHRQLETIGASGRYYETMAFKAKKDGEYWEADIFEQVSFESEWAICAESPEALPDDVDNRADQMHEAVVAELSNKLASKDSRGSGSHLKDG